MVSTAATVFQRNKQSYVHEENKLEEIVSDASFLDAFQSWLDTSISQLDYQYERCEQQLTALQQSVAVQGGTFWCSKTIIEHCNLHMSEKRLYRRGDTLEENHPELPDLIRLKSCLQQTKEHSYITPKQRRFLEQCEEEFKKVYFEPRDLLFITNALQTKLKDDGNTRGVFSDLTKFQNCIEGLSPDVDQCEQLLEASIVNGEMGLAEDISKRQLDIYEHILTLITDQYPVIRNYYSESRNSDRRRRWAVFRMADKDISAVIEGKFRQVESCEEDLQKIHDQVRNYTNDDVQQRKRYETDREQSDTFLQQNKERQQSVWNRIFNIFEELRTSQAELAHLARDRKKEIDRRLLVEEREAGRRSGHEAFLQAASSHAQWLQDTIDNAVHAREVSEALSNFVLDGCDSITAKYDKQQNSLSEMLRLVQQHHFRRFSDYYVAASRYLYRKERRLEQLDEEIDRNDMQRQLLAETLNPIAKKHADANVNLALKRREVAQEVLCIHHKLEKAEKAIKPTLRSLDFADIEYVHPRRIVEEMNLNRWSTILNYRELVDPTISEMERLHALEKDSLLRLRFAMEQQGILSIDAAGNYRSNVSQKRRMCSPSGRLHVGPQGTRSAHSMSSVLTRRVEAMLGKSLPNSQGSGRRNDVGRDALNVSSPPRPNIDSDFSSPANNKGSLAGGQQAVAAVTPSASAPPAASPTAVAVPSTAIPHVMEGSTFRAMYPYRARAPDELSFDEHDLIVCICSGSEEGWFKGVCNQRTGLFPINYVERLTGAGYVER